jgi:hypothetical protein
LKVALLLTFKVTGVPPLARATFEVKNSNSVQSKVAFLTRFGTLATEWSVATDRITHVTQYKLFNYPDLQVAAIDVS